jgi:prepilin-type N-terminal cleavage/methylation domain-containing protein
MNKLKIRDKTGFTLIEILLVVSIIGLIMGVTIPASYEMYLNYKNSLHAEEVLAYVSNVRRESFLYGEETVLSSKEGRIQPNNSALIGFADLFVQIDTPIKFYKNGTTSGGVLKIQAGDSVYRLKVTAPFGNLLLERGT